MTPKQALRAAHNKRMSVELKIMKQKAEIQKLEYEMDFCKRGLGGLTRTIPMKQGGMQSYMSNAVSNTTKK